MKQLLLIAFLIVSSFTAAQAGSGLTKSANDSAIAAGRVALNAKINQFSANASSSAASAATLQSAKELLDLMRSGMAQTMHSMELSGSLTDSRGINTRYLQLEKATNEYVTLMSSVAQNYSGMIQQAQTFYSKY